MFEGEIERDFVASGLDAWLRLGIDPATDSGRDMTVGDNSVALARSGPWSRYAQC